MVRDCQPYVFFLAGKRTLRTFWTPVEANSSVTPWESECVLTVIGLGVFMSDVDLFLFLFML